jgi:hypothetical protein
MEIAGKHTRKIHVVSVGRLSAQAIAALVAPNIRMTTQATLIASFTVSVPVMRFVHSALVLVKWIAKDLYDFMNCSDQFALARYWLAQNRTIRAIGAPIFGYGRGACQ